MFDVKSQVIKKLRMALLSQSQINGINLQKLRIKLSRGEGLKVEILNGTEKVTDSSVREAVPFKSVEKFARLPETIENTMIKSLLDLSASDNINEDMINVRIYAKDPSGTPAMYLFNENSSIRPLDEDEVMSLVS